MSKDLFAHMPSHLKKCFSSFCFNRWGGVSKPPFDELNVGYGIGDEPRAVVENIDILKKTCGVSIIFSVRQVHGTKIYNLDEVYDPVMGKTGEIEADGIMTAQLGIGLMIKTADCQPVAMFDPVNKVIANIHCGWRGNVQSILAKAVSRLSIEYGSSPRDLWVGIGPSLGPCCAEFKGWRQLLPKWMHKFQIRPDYFDFWAISKRQLMEAGVPEGQIHVLQICTFCSKDYFSYRREKLTGRQATVVALLP